MAIFQPRDPSGKNTVFRGGGGFFGSLARSGLGEALAAGVKQGLDERERDKNRAIQSRQVDVQEDQLALSRTQDKRQAELDAVHLEAAKMRLGWLEKDIKSIIGLRDAQAGKETALAGGVPLRIALDERRVALQESQFETSTAINVHNLNSAYITEDGERPDLRLIRDGENGPLSVVDAQGRAIQPTNEYTQLVDAFSSVFDGDRDFAEWMVQQRIGVSEAGHMFTTRQMAEQLELIRAQAKYYGALMRQADAGTNSARGAQASSIVAESLKGRLLEMQQATYGNEIRAFNTGTHSDAAVSKEMSALMGDLSPGPWVRQTLSGIMPALSGMTNARPQDVLEAARVELERRLVPQVLDQTKAGKKLAQVLGDTDPGNIAPEQQAKVDTLRAQAETEAKALLNGIVVSFFGGVVEGGKKTVSKEDQPSDPSKAMPLLDYLAKTAHQWSLDNDIYNVLLNSARVRNNFAFMDQGAPGHIDYLRTGGNVQGTGTETTTTDTDVSLTGDALGDLTNTIDDLEQELGGEN